MVDTGVYEAVTGYPAKALRKQVDPNSRRDFFVRGVLPVLCIIILICLMVACGHGRPSVREAVDLCRGNLVMVHVEAERITGKHRDAAALVVDRCRAQLGSSATALQREHCVAGHGMALDDVRARVQAFAAVAEAYDSIVEALDQIEDAIPTIGEAEAVADDVLEEGGER